MAPTEPRGRERAGSRFYLGAVLLAVVVFGSTALRIHEASSDPNFGVRGAAGALKSDPALLYYLTQRLIESEGVPADFRADPRIEHPATVDVPATFTVGQEFLLAWIGRLSGAKLMRLSVVVMAFTAALAAVGTYGAAWVLTRSVGWSSFAALVWGLLPANYRTVGFVLVREDLSLPLYALHLWWLARAARHGRTRDYLGAGFFLGAAAATWHAMGFLIALEAACFLAWFLWRDENPFGCPRTWIVPALLLVFTLLVPALRAKQAALAPPLQVCAALLVAARLRTSTRVLRAGAALVCLVVLFAVSRAMDTSGDFSHVPAVLLAKLVHLGSLPFDPSALSFEARMMWQGPFATLTPLGALRVFNVALLVALPWLAVVLREVRRGGGDRCEGVLCLLTLASLAAAWFVMRLFVLAGLLLPVVVALALRRVAEGATSATRLWVPALVLVIQAAFLFAWFSGREIPWYLPRVQNEEIAEMVANLPLHVPEREAVAGDSVNSAAILAHTGRPIVVQPKWERAESRRRVRDFFETFFQGTPEDLRELLLERYDCRYLLVDRFMLWFRGRYLGGIPLTQHTPNPGSAAAALLSQDEGVLRSIPGYELLWRSSPTIMQSDGKTPSDFFRLFRLQE